MSFGQDFLPESRLNLTLSAPIATWDEGIPLGNGLLGGILWGKQNQINVSLDRGDLWDERSANGMDWSKFTYANLIDLVGKKDTGKINDWFERAYNDVHPTKLPGGRLVIVLDPAEKVRGFGLDLAKAEGNIQLETGREVKAIWSSNEKAGIFKFPEGIRPILELWTPAMVASNGQTDTGPNSAGVGRLGYEKSTFGEETREAVSFKWYVQPAAQGLVYVVLVGAVDTPNGVVAAVTITSTDDAKDPLEFAKDRIGRTLKKSIKSIWSKHQSEWKNFWKSSSISVPDEAIQQHYYLVRYFYGSSSRRGAPPIPLQGVWTADAGNLPPWKGDYHNDLNTQMTYMGYQASGDWNSGLSYLDFLWERRERFRRFAREFYGTSGLSVPGVMTLKGEPLSGWSQYSLSPTMTAWSAHLFYLHWRYTADENFLRKRAYPWCRDAGICLEQLLKPDGNGRLVLPLSSSPEIFDDSLRAWLKPNSNYDIMSLRMLFLALVEMEKSLGKLEESARWQELSDRLGPFHVRPDGTLKISENEDLPGSHRHLSNLMALHPFNLIHPENGPDQRKIVEATLAEWDRFGTKAWVGYSFTWMSALRARIGDAEEAFRLLDVFVKAFILRNGFHANGDQSGKGYSDFRYRPFTLEGNFLAMNAVHEMLLQSWSPDPGTLNGEILRIFPATTDRWANASFRGLRAEGGYTVSAERRNRLITSVSIRASRNGQLRIKNTFAPTFVWNSNLVTKQGDLILVPMERGQTLNGRLK